jgi:hypothetical protein
MSCSLIMFSAAVEDVRMSYSETVVAPVVALAMLNRYGLDECSKMRYNAYAFDFQNVIERHASAEADSPGAACWIAVSEDDIVLTTLSVQAHKRLVRLCPACPSIMMSCMWNGGLTYVKSAALGRARQTFPVSC